jgi:hypothetical protein
MTKTSPTPTCRTVSNVGWPTGLVALISTLLESAGDDGELTAELLFGLVERQTLPSAGQIWLRAAGCCGERPGIQGERRW